MRHFLLAAALLAGSAAHAQDCGAWIAEVWETEGGEAMTAHVCEPSVTGRDAMIFVQCDGPETYAVFFDDGGDGGPVGGDPNLPVDVTFAVGGTELTEEMVYQGIDGTYYASMPADSDLDRLFRSGGEMSVTPATNDLHVQSFPLEGAGEALDQILADCGG